MLVELRGKLKYHRVSKFVHAKNSCKTNCMADKNKLFVMRCQSFTQNERTNDDRETQHPCKKNSVHLVALALETLDCSSHSSLCGYWMDCFGPIPAIKDSE